MSITQKWMQLVAAALRQGVRWVYEGLQGPSAGLSEVPEGNHTQRTPQRLRWPLSNPDTQESDDAAE